MLFWPVQVTSAEISPHLSVHQESEQQLQVQVGLYAKATSYIMAYLVLIAQVKLGCYL